MFQDAAEAVSPEIQSLIQNYFDLHTHQNMRLFDKVFHPHFFAYANSQGDLDVLHRSHYREQVEKYRPLDSGESGERNLVFSIDEISETLARVEVQLDVCHRVTTDSLCLIFEDKQWWVMMKRWEPRTT